MLSCCVKHPLLKEVTIPCSCTRASLHVCVCKCECEENGNRKKEQSVRVKWNTHDNTLRRHFFHLLQFLSNLLFLNNRFGFVDLRARLLLLLRLVFSLTHSLIAIINKIMRGNDENRERITQLEMKYQFWSLNTRPFVRACSCGRLKTFVCSVDDR